MKTVWVVYYVGNFESYVAGIFSNEKKANRWVSKQDSGRPVYQVHEERVR